MLNFIKWLFGVGAEEQEIINSIKENKENLTVSSRGGCSKDVRPLTEEEIKRFAHISEKIESYKTNHNKF